MDLEKSLDTTKLLNDAKEFVDDIQLLHDSMVKCITCFGLSEACKDFEKEYNMLVEWGRMTQEQYDNQLDKYIVEIKNTMCYGCEWNRYDKRDIIVN